MLHRQNRTFRTCLPERRKSREASHQAIDEYIGFLEYKLESTELVLQTKEQELSQLRKENETLRAKLREAK